ncbi:MAG TPA: ABC transporter ATP-binding protein [Fibrobacteria bacterium]|nr:ABC transporter ATP-binding protein [Fibrobacteria bacterium]
MSTILTARNLSKTYGATRVLHGLDMVVKAGESVAILGQSGSGKTTLLSLLAGLEPPDEGQVLFDGKDLGALRTDGLARLRGKSMGIIFQEYHLVPSLTARENVTLPLEIQGAKDPGSKADALLDRVGLTPRSRHYPHQLSGGEQQRVAIARALAAGPRLLFADEPTGNLDESTAEEVESLIFSLIAEQGLTAVVVTHNQELAARCSRVLTLHLGRFG